MKRSTLTRRRFLAASAATVSFPAVLHAAEREAGKEVPWLADLQCPPALRVGAHEFDVGVCCHVVLHSSDAIDASGGRGEPREHRDCDLSFG